MLCGQKQIIANSNWARMAFGQVSCICFGRGMWSALIVGVQVRVGMYNLQLDIVDKNNLKSHIACQPIHNNIFKLGMQ